MNDPTRRQTSFNLASRGQWGGFAGHRETVTSLLGGGTAPGQSRLSVLGAGNSNDLDLPTLLKAHREVHLVDLDSEALSQGVTRQCVAGHPALHQWGGIDLTGMLDAIAAWSPRASIGLADLTALAEWPAGRVGMALAGPYDRVASTCLLSQLIGNAFHAVGERHPQFLELVRALRLGHLRLLSRLVAPGGTAVLITDVVSSDTLPELGRLPEAALPGLLPRLAETRNFFHGVNPAALLATFRQDPVLSAQVGGLELIPPWRWNLHSRVYLVCGIRFQVRRC